MFGEWEQLVVRLDVWHLMRRFARAVTTDSHQLYGLFMSRLSFAFFEWDSGDVARLQEAKQSEGGPDAHAEPTSRELARHCRRRTRGEEETGWLNQEVLDVLATDSMGVPLIDSARMVEVWSTQRRHLCCIQDPPGVELYAKTGEVTRGGFKLPVFRCARGSTSLESFHLHLCRFIPVRTCQSCGQPSCKEFGHSQLNLKTGKVWYCALRDGISLDLWLARHRAREKEDVQDEEEEEEDKEEEKKNKQ
ncbi:uncharacterized protein [Paralichthys olivaceus]|uniref:uncharacterized protein n=1 Tax=Paralichthys olivaceus TaxID=8255 RepID=UPI00375328F0